MEFESWPKIPRSKQNGIIITEKLDGTNAQVAINESGEMFVGSRNRWLGPGQDNFGFHAWCMEHRDELLTLGAGRHYGEWYGAGIQRRYGLDHKRFALFNVFRPAETLPACVEQVPVLYKGDHTHDAIEQALNELQIKGSHAVPGFMQPEGIVVYSFLTKGRIKYTYEGK
jgi:hypothetical protein